MGERRLVVAVVRGSWLGFRVFALVVGLLFVAAIVLWVRTGVDFGVVKRKVSGDFEYLNCNIWVSECGVLVAI